MPLYTIRRAMEPGATQDDLDAAAMRAISCANEFQGLRWVRSYFDLEGSQVLCLYEAKDAAQVTDHARRASIPCDEVREVTEVYPAQYAGA